MIIIIIIVNLKSFATQPLPLMDPQCLPSLSPMPKSWTFLAQFDLVVTRCALCIKRSFSKLNVIWKGELVFLSLQCWIAFLHNIMLLSQKTIWLYGQGCLWIERARKIKIDDKIDIHRAANLKRGTRQNQRISVSEIMLIPRQRPRRPPMLLIKLTLSTSIMSWYVNLNWGW